MFINKGAQNAERIKTICQAYKQRKEPGIHMDEEQLRNKKVAGDPATTERAEIRNQCSPKGPVGFLLESLHLQAATMDEGYKVQQNN